MDAPALQRHRIERIRREPKRRRLTVVARLRADAERCGGSSSPRPSCTTSPAPEPDDHIKLFVPDPASPGGVAMRDYTPRAFDAGRGNAHGRLRPA